MRQITINGKKYGFRFSLLAAREYQRLTGSGLESLNGEVSFDSLVNIVYCGLAGAAKKNRQEFTMTVDDVAIELEDEVESNGMSVFDTITELIGEDLAKLTGEGNGKGAAKAPKKKATSGTK